MAHANGGADHADNYAFLMGSSFNRFIGNRYKEKRRRRKQKRKEKKEDRYLYILIGLITSIVTLWGGARREKLWRSQFNSLRTR